MNNDKGPQRTAQILRFNGITKLDLSPDLVLGDAIEADLSCVTILGYRQDGSEYFSSTMSDGADVLWLMERLKLQILKCEGSV